MGGSKLRAAAIATIGGMPSVKQNLGSTTNMGRKSVQAVQSTKQNPDRAKNTKPESMQDVQNVKQNLDSNKSMVMESVQEVSQVGQGSIYYLPYDYYIPSSERVFRDWECGTKDFYRQFCNYTAEKMSRDYDEHEARIFFRVFQDDMEYMCCEKIIQEARILAETGGLSKSIAAGIIDKHSEYLFEKRKKLKALRSQAPETGFTENDLWFASFSRKSVQGFVKGDKEYAGSIYFNDGRIRLMHDNGPFIYKGSLIREYSGRELSKNSVLPPEIEGVPLVEYEEIRIGGRIKGVRKNVVHISRGIPRPIKLDNSEIAQLWYLVTRLEGIGKSDTIRKTGNKILRQFFYKNRSLSKKLGYDGNMY